MQRRNAIKIIAVSTAGVALGPWLGEIMSSHNESPRNSLEKTRMPLFFIGHGSPMNAIDTNSYTNMLSRLADTFARPKAILVISAHWMTKGTWVTEMEKPKTIYDFYGFPKELSEVVYPAPGSVQLARTVRDIVTRPKVGGDVSEWGLDHGTWAVLKHLYPKADIPVIQLSLDLDSPMDEHYRIGREISKLRDEGVLILGSGNIVHNLRQIRWGADAKAYDWAIEFDEWVKQKLMGGDHAALLHGFRATNAGRLSVPTIEHYLPLAYILGAASPKDELSFDFEEMQNGSISMRSLRFA